MRNPIEHVRLSLEAKNKLVRLKRRTGLAHWNVLCRWAYCASLADPTTPTPAVRSSDTAIEMTWKVFAGRQSGLYFALLWARCARDGLGLDEELLQAQFRAHLHRGIAQLSGPRGVRSLADLTKLAHPRSDSAERSA